MKKRTIISILLLAAVFILQSCNSEDSKKATFTLDNLTIFAEGPLFEGSNTGQVEVSDALAGFLKENNLTEKQLSNASLSTCKISYSPESDSVEMQNLNMLESLTLQFAADELDMMSLGVINPIPEGQNEVNLNISDEQDGILEFLKQSSFYVVTDAILEQDLIDDMKLSCSLTFEIEYK